MILFPAIDVLGGQCVRLTRGDRGQATVYNPDPVDQARHFLRQGARALHIVDLDAAFDGRSENAPVVERIVREAKKHNVFVQLGGGLRSKEAVERWLEMGVDRVVVATLALENLPLALTLCETWRERIAIALDLREGKVATRGWLVHHNFSGDNLAERDLDARNLAERDLDAHTWLAPFIEVDRRIGAVVVTDITRDGMLSGANEALTLSFARTLPCPVIASGGIASIEDLVALARTGVVEGAICGRALYEGKFSLEEALLAVAAFEETRTPDS